jgi:porphobilinogen synthase
MSEGRFPGTRLRRTRKAPWARRLVAEARLAPADLIWPIFVRDGVDLAEPIATMPGVFRHSVDRLPALAREAADLGIPAIALFPYTPADRRTPDGAEALNPDNLVCRALRAVKESGAPVGLMADVALDPYTSHGHDGLLDPAGGVANDATVAVLVRQALVQAEAGADILAPSDMMDGRVGAIREALEGAGRHDAWIMAYAAKYASGFYGPFRDAVGASGHLKGDKKGYQMDPANGQEALREVALDIAEGADSVMVKPGLPYLDVVARVAERFDVPVFAYCVSGEYAMVEAAAAAGMLDRAQVILELLTGFRRAGAAGILTYHAPEAARLLAR